MERNLVRNRRNQRQESKKSSTALALEANSQIGDMEKLVAELLKDRPSVGIVKDYMNRLQLPFSEDPIQRLSTVLLAVQNLQK